MTDISYPTNELEERREERKTDYNYKEALAFVKKLWNDTKNNAVKVCAVTQCGSTITQNQDFAAHMKTVHAKIKDFRCTKCTYSSQKTYNSQRFTS